MQHPGYGTVCRVEVKVEQRRRQRRRKMNEYFYAFFVGRFVWYCRLPPNNGRIVFVSLVVLVRTQ